MRIAAPLRTPITTRFPQLQASTSAVIKALYWASLALWYDTVDVSAQNFPIVEIAHRHQVNEPSIAINPTNPANLIVGTNLHHIFVSFDTGHTWKWMRMHADPYRVYGDPVVIYDTAGHAYFFSLCDGEHWLDRLLCHKSTDGGQSWTLSSHIGYAPPTDQDKEWAAYDPTRNAIYLLWTRFDNYGSTDPQDSSYILFSKSKDGGQTWTTPLRINHIAGDCIDSDCSIQLGLAHWASSLTALWMAE